MREIVFARVAFFRNLVQSEFPLEIFVDISEDGFHRHAFVEKSRSVFGAVYQPENVHYERSGNVLANFHIKPFFKFEFGDESGEITVENVVHFFRVKNRTVRFGQKTVRRKIGYFEFVVSDEKDFHRVCFVAFFAMRHTAVVNEQIAFFHLIVFIVYR